MIELKIGSDAYGELWRMLDTTGAYIVRIEERKDGVALKLNEGVWTPTLACVPNPGTPPLQPRSFIEGTEDEAPPTMTFVELAALTHSTRAALNISQDGESLIVTMKDTASTLLLQHVLANRGFRYGRDYDQNNSTFCINRQVD